MRLMPVPRGTRGCSPPRGPKKRIPPVGPSLRLKIPHGFAGASFPGFDQAVPFTVGFLVDLTARWIGVEPGERPPDALPERHGGAIAGNEPLDLAVIEDHADGLVARQAAQRLG